MPSTNTGNVDALCTSATHSGEGPSDVISQADATSFIHMQVFAASQVTHNMRNTLDCSGPKADSGWTTGRRVSVSSKMESGKGATVSSAVPAPAGRCRGASGSD